VNAVGEPGGTDRVRIESNSPLVGQMLRHAGLPISVIVTTIQRRRDLVVPDGRTVLEAGDELLLIGQSSDIDGIRRVAGVVFPIDAHKDLMRTTVMSRQAQSMLALGFRDTCNEAGRARDDRWQPSIRRADSGRRPRLGAGSVGDGRSEGPGNALPPSIVGDRCHSPIRHPCRARCHSAKHRRRSGTET